MFPVIQVPPEAYDLPEQLGTKRKFWYRDEGQRFVLFKEGRPNTGENWAEKVNCEICGLLALPHALYDFAKWRDHDGVVTPKFLSEDSRLVLGNELLAKLIKDYVHTSRYQARQHTVQVVMSIMRWPELGLPEGYVSPDPAITKPADVFIGYLMLDALVSNQDRHHENWGLVLGPNRKVTITPTFDHASSLGRNETDESRERRLKTKDRGDSVESYVLRARSALYSGLRDAKPLLTFDAFIEAAKSAPLAGNYWLDRLQATTKEQFEAIFADIPPHLISDAARRFALRMLEVNRLRLLEARMQLQA
jgi:hypothetical protein